MRYCLLYCVALFAVLLFLVDHAVAQEPGFCYVIGDADQRALCLAKARKQPAMCYSIRSLDLRSQCLAEVRR